MIKLFFLLGFLTTNGFLMINKNMRNRMHIYNEKNYDNNKYSLSSLKFIEMMRMLNNNNNISKNVLTETEIQNHIEESLKERMLINKSKYMNAFGIRIEIEGIQPNPYDTPSEDKNDDDESYNDKDESYKNSDKSDIEKKSKNFEVVMKSDITFKDVGGYENIKSELKQCVDILKNYEKYKKYNVRVPKGLILEGLPGTGKTMLAKSFASEANCSFIAVAGSDFQEKYVGVGPSRIKELFKLAKKNIPCIIFIDEIDALGKKRSSDGESSSNERDSTLNALLVELDGFRNNSGVFLIAATNRADLLDNALTRPGRIDKNIYIGLPDKNTRKEIIKIHIKGKPYDDSVKIDDILETTQGLSGAQIENLLNEAMLNALKYNNEYFTNVDLELNINKILAGWQPIEHEFTSDTIDRIAIHEMGHAVTGYLSKFHSNITKVVINLFSPKSPGYTVFENTLSSIYTKEALFEHLMILLSGRIAEEIYYNTSVTTGAINDFEEALKLAEKMIIYYGMGSELIYPNNSEKYKELIDDEVKNIINKAYNNAKEILLEYKNIIYEGARILIRDKNLTAIDLEKIINNK
jgi:cell division protease FtsH